MSQHVQSDVQLAEQIREIYQVHQKRYGSPRVHAELQEQGTKCARKRVARLMREQGLAARRPRHRTITTQSDVSARVVPNSLNREFTATRPNARVDGGYYRDLDVRGMAVRRTLILDLFSRRVVGWAMGASADEPLVEMARLLALLQRHPPVGLLHHTDRGSQYTSTVYQALLAEKGVLVSMSRTGKGFR